MAEHDFHQVAFPKLDDVQVATLAKFGTRRLLHAGELLFQAGAREYKFFVVERGAVEIVEHSSGEPKTVTVHEVHEFGGDVSLVTGRPALISAVARGDTEVFEIAPGDIRRIMGERPALGEPPERKIYGKEPLHQVDHRPQTAEGCALGRRAEPRAGRQNTARPASQYSR